MNVGVMTEIDWATTLETLGAVFEGAGLTEAVAAATGGAGAFANYMGLGSGIATAGGQAISTSVATGTASQALAVYTGEQALSGAATRGALSAMNYALAEGTSGLTVGGVISATAPVLLAAGAAALGYSVGDAFNQTELGQRVQEKLIQLTDPLVEKGVSAYRCFVGPDGQVYAPKEIIDNIKQALHDEGIDSPDQTEAGYTYPSNSTVPEDKRIPAPFNMEKARTGINYSTMGSLSSYYNTYRHDYSVGSAASDVFVLPLNYTRQGSSVWFVSASPFTLIEKVYEGGSLKNTYTRSAGSSDGVGYYISDTDSGYYPNEEIVVRDASGSKIGTIPVNTGVNHGYGYDGISNVVKTVLEALAGVAIEGLTKFAGTSPVDYTEGAIDVATGSVVDGTAETVPYVPISIASNNPLVTTDAASATAPSPWEAIKDFISNVAPEIGYQPGTAPTIGNRTTVTPNPADPSAPAVDPSADPSIPLKEAKIGSKLLNPSGKIGTGSTPPLWSPWTGDTGIIPHAPDFGSDGAPGLIHVYNPSNAAMVNFGAWLFATYEEAGQRGDPMLYNNPFDGVIEAFEIYVTPVEAYTER